MSYDICIYINLHVNIRLKSNFSSLKYLFENAGRKAGEGARPGGSDR